LLAILESQGAREGGGAANARAQIEWWSLVRVGQKVAGYEIVAELKAGGMATMFLGRRGGAAGFAKHVAIKVIHSHLAKDESFVRMFLDEARLSARIEHPNVVHVHDLGEEAGMYFMVMEYINGCSLAALVQELRKRDRKLSTELTAWIGQCVAAGLHAAHEATDDEGVPLGVVHRDVSPQNVLLAFKGYLKLIDFGIAKAAGRQQQTAAGLLKGKFRYMAPEQARGRAVDRRTDVYALGIMLWELLTMRKLFDGDNDLAILDQVREPKVEPPSAYAPEVPPALDAVILKALSADPDGRPATAHEFRQMLAAAAPGSLSIDAMQISQLVRAVMSEAIAEERSALPDSVSGVLPPTPTGGPSAAPVLQELTLCSSPGTPDPAPEEVESPTDGTPLRPAAGSESGRLAAPLASSGSPSPAGSLSSMPPSSSVAPSSVLPSTSGPASSAPASPGASAAVAMGQMRSVGQASSRVESHPRTMVMANAAVAAAPAEASGEPGTQSGVHGKGKASWAEGPIAQTRVLPAATFDAAAANAAAANTAGASISSAPGPTAGAAPYVFEAPRKSRVPMLLASLGALLLVVGGGGAIIALVAVNDQDRPPPIERPAGDVTTSAGERTTTTANEVPDNDAPDVTSAARQAALEAERAEAERAEAERAETERAETERAEAERAETERAEAERAEAERAETERAETDAERAREAARARDEERRASRSERDRRRGTMQSTTSSDVGGVPIIRNVMF
jgi:serine/threonine-protein kinase